MSDRESDNKILDLRADFPAVPTEAWEAAIRTDLRGADYDKKLVWKSEEGITLRPYYRQESLKELKGQTQVSPGQPFCAGHGTRLDNRTERAGQARCHSCRSAA